MSEQYVNEPMLEMYIFETSQNIDQLEEVILECEQSNCFTEDAINAIFRCMHTIKGSSAMMLFNDISILAHRVEDVFFFMRDHKPENVDCPTLTDLVLESIDFMKVELEKIKAGIKVDGDAGPLTEKILEFLEYIKHMNPGLDGVEPPAKASQGQFYIAADKKAAVAAEPAANKGKHTYKAVLRFQDGCEMENIRAYTVVHNLTEKAKDIAHIPEDLIESDKTIDEIRANGFTLYINTDDDYEAIDKHLNQTIFLDSISLEEVSYEDISFFASKQAAVKEEKTVAVVAAPVAKDEDKDLPKQAAAPIAKSEPASIISVNVNRLDTLMDLVGEMVIAEAMVTQNPEIAGLEIDSFEKAARQLEKIITELQDVVMSIRMVPLSMTFQRMHRIVRDMSKRLEKDIKLELIGEHTEVDKNVIDKITDPLMHLVRNSLDHGIESPEEREAAGKAAYGTITLEAHNSGSDVVIVVRDDGRGLNKEKLLKKAKENGILTKEPEQMTDREIYNLILLPGFSTKENVSEFSGRGVGMDVVTKNIEAVSGSVAIDSSPGKGSTITIKIPLTLAIIDGMNISVGKSYYTIPITAIKESFRPVKEDIIVDPNKREMIMVRGECHPIIRLHEYYKVETDIHELTEGILIMAEQDEETICIFADELLGQYQVVVKTLPNYIKRIKNITGLAGCTVLGDGNISLIIDVAGLLKDR